MELIKSIVKVLEENNHEMVFDWSKLGSPILYNENAEHCTEIAHKIAYKIQDAEVFVLLSDPAGTDMFVELGIAIANYSKNKQSRIYIVGENNKRSLMHFHPSIIHVNTLEEIFSKECPEIQNFPKETLK